MVSQTVVHTQPRPGSPGLLAGGLSLTARFLVWLLLSLLVSILIEWAGMGFGWWSSDDHARTMLERELNYLDRDFATSLISTSPMAFARSLVDSGQYWLFEASGLIRLRDWLAAPVTADDHNIRLTLRAVYLPLGDYLAAAMAITQLFLVRLAILTLASPVFLLAGLVALVDGLGQRDVRRWSGGRESSFLYHHAKATLVPLLTGAWVVYLALPVSVHPNGVILPFAALFGLAMAVTTASFKKYL